MKKYIYILILIIIIINSSLSQEAGRSTYYINKTDSLVLCRIPKFEVPEIYKNKNPLTLPDFHDNSVWPYLRPPFEQDGYSCAQASSIGYNFTYEINRARDLSANFLQNQYPSGFHWNFFNNGQYEQGVNFFYTFDAIKSGGQPNVSDFGAMGGGHKKWMTGYEKYYNGMFNRFSDIYSIYVGDPNGLTTLKQWVFDHMEGSQYGGLANFYTDSNAFDSLPNNTPEAGKYVITHFGIGSGHSMTIIGWNDSIRFDYNNDGLYTNDIDINDDQVVDMKDWEIGGFKFINSFGDDWANNGFCYMMYKTVAEEKQDGGIWNKSVYIIDVKADHEPLLTYKITLKHTSRNKIKVRSGVSTDTTDVWPEFIHEFDIFKYQGGENYMLGGTTLEENKTIEFGLDVSSLLSYIKPNQPAKFFLQIHEYDPSNTSTGKIVNFSVIDYLNNELEIICPETDVEIEKNAYTTLYVIHTADPELLTIETNELPAFSSNQQISVPLEASGGSPPYSWDILSLYDESHFTGDYPIIETEQLNPQGGSGSGRVIKDIEFEFPFYGKKYSTLTIHTDGMLGFRDEKLPIPHQVDPLYLFRYATFISPFYNMQIEYNTSQNDKIWYDGNENYAAFRWDVTLNINGDLISTDFCIILYPNGNIEYYYKDFETMSGSQWLTGISAGDGINYQVSEFSQTLAKGTQVIRYIPQNILSSYEISKEGILTALPTNDQTIYNLTVKVTDDDWIFSTKKYQLSSGLIFDYSITSGDDDQVDYGETAYLDLSLKNVSSSQISSIVFVTNSDDPYVEFIDYAENIGTINPGETVTFTNAISFKASSQVPDNYFLPFDVLITSATNTCESRFAIKVNAPFIQMGKPFVINSEDGWLNPGETGKVVVPIINMGHSKANEIYRTIGSASSFVSINTPTTKSFGDLAKGITIYDTINITIDEDCPQGINIVFDYEIKADPNINIAESFELVIGRYPVIVIDLGSDLTSGSITKTLLENLYVNYKYVNYIPDDLTRYQNLLVLLGRKFNNYVLTESDGELFENFLLSGGNIYMEGGLTWNEDPETAVHAMFNINSESVGWSAIDPVTGVNGTFTEGFEFNYDGTLIVYGNFLIPVAPAFSILKKEDIDHVFMVAYDEGSYKTVGSNFDFTGLIDGEYPSSRENLLAKILTFFGQDIVFSDNAISSNYNKYKLSCHPNPFTSFTTLRFYLPQKDNIDLSIYNMKGQKVSTIVSQTNLPMGTHNFKLDRNLLPQGTYHCILTTKATKSSIKLVIIN